MIFKGLIALQAISNGALVGDLPKRVKLLNWGDNPSLKGNIKIGPKTLAALSANQNRLGFDKIGFDYEHQSLEGHKNFKPSPREYAAYGTPVVVEGEGLFVDAIAYTPSGHKNAPNYHDLSPVVFQDDSGEVTFIHSVALCPQGAVEGLSFYNSDFDPMKLTALSPELKKVLSAIFGTPEDADEATLLTAAQAFADDLKKTLDAKKTEKKPEDGNDSELKALSARLDELATGFETREREDILAAALRDGKLVPNSAKTLPIASLRAIVAELEPGMVPLEKRTPDQVKALSVSISATDLAVAKQLGLKPEDLAK